MEEPQSLVDNAEVWTREYLSALANEDVNPSHENKKRRKAAEGKYAQKDVRMVLNRMFHRKCGFCERKRDYPHIEHFRPKNTYPDKCFDWDNFILACEVCNGPEYKGTKFPLGADGSPLFVNPCIDNPEDHFEFLFEKDENHPDGFITVLRPKTKKGRVTIKEIGLNRPNLIEERNDLLYPFYPKLAEYAGQGDHTSKQLLKRACQAKSPFAAFARSLWRKYIGAEPYS